MSKSKKSVLVVIKLKETYKNLINIFVLQNQEECFLHKKL